MNFSPATAASSSSYADAAHRGSHGDAHAHSSEFLAFRLGAEEYGIDILRVQEIRSFEQPTRIAGAPHHLLGVTNLRGVIVPIVDLRLKFACAQAEFGPFTVVIVLNIGARVVGAVVDAVSDVLRLTDDQIRPAPELAGEGSAYITGIGNMTTEGRERMLILLDIEALMMRADMGLV